MMTNTVTRPAPQLHRNAYVTRLSPAQSAWLEKNGIEFVCNANTTGYAYNCYRNRATGFYIEVYGGSTWGAFYVARQPTTEEEGPDCNDGEPVRLADFQTLKAALAHLVARPASAR